jgi:hypothetical protein
MRTPEVSRRATGGPPPTVRPWPAASPSSSSTAATPRRWPPSGPPSWTTGSSAGRRTARGDRARRPASAAPRPRWCSAGGRPDARQGAAAHRRQRHRPRPGRRAGAAARLGATRADVGQTGTRAGTCSPTRRATSSACCAPPRPALTHRTEETHGVGERVDQGVPGGLDDVVVDADGGPLPHPVGGVDEHPGGGAGAALPAEDADLVVGQRDAGQLRVPADQRLAQRVVQRVDRAVALGGADDPLAVHVHLDRRLADHDAVAPVLDGGPGSSPARTAARGVGQLGAQQQLEGGVGGLERPAVGLEHLDLVDDPADGVGLAGQVDAELAALELDRGPAGHLGDQDAHVVADDRRVEVVVELGAHLDRAGVQAGLVRERRGADEGLVVVGGDVGQLGDGVADPLQLRQALRRARPAGPSW